MEKSTKMLLKYIIDVEVELCKIEEIFNQGNFLKPIDIGLNLGCNSLRTILDAFEVDEKNGEKMFKMYDKLYENKINSQELVDRIEKILDK